MVLSNTEKQVAFRKRRQNRVEFLELVYFYLRMKELHTRYLASDELGLNKRLHLVCCMLYDKKISCIMEVLSYEEKKDFQEKVKETFYKDCEKSTQEESLELHEGWDSPVTLDNVHVPTPLELRGSIALQRCAEREAIVFGGG